MRDWTVRWVSVVVVIWVYSSSLALSSTSLWLAARYLRLGKPSHHHHQPHHRHHKQRHVTASNNKLNRISTTSTAMAAMRSRGGAGDCNSDDRNDDDNNNNNNNNNIIINGNNLQPDDFHNAVVDESNLDRQILSAVQESHNDDDDDDGVIYQQQDYNSKATTKTISMSTTMSKWTSKFHERGGSLWPNRKTEETQEGKEDEFNHSSTRPSNASSSASSSSSLIPIRLSKKYNWDHFSQRLQQYRRKGGRFLNRKNKTLNERQLSFLDRMALVSTAFWNRETEALLENTTSTTASKSSSGGSLLWSLRRPKVAVENETFHQLDDSWITAQSDLTLPGRHITIVTTAALPWMTGTAVNPLLRAANLCRRTRVLNNSTTQQWVTLVIPWLELTEDQQEVYQRVFSSPQEQEEYIRNWLRNEAGLADVADAETGLKIIFYPARYHAGMRSVFAMGDICSLIPNDEADVCILEEPEHCNWFRAPGDGWTRKFHYVVGVVHTNYKEYASAQYHGLWTAPALAVISSAMVRAYCHKVIKLSDVLQTFAPEKETTSNVHGVRSDFLEEGLRRSKLELEHRAHDLTSNDKEDGHSDAERQSSSGVYFIGKLLWAKGLDLLLELEDYYKQCTGDFFPIDVYGSGPDEKEIRRAYLGRSKPAKPKQQTMQAPATRPRRFLLWDRKRSRASRNQQTSAEQIEAKRTVASSLHILGTTMSLEGGTVGTSSSTDSSQHHEQFEVEQANNASLYGEVDKDPLNESLGDNAEVDTWFASFSSLSTSLREILRDRARERLVKIKETIKSTTESIEIPRTLHELRRSPIPATFPGRVDHSSLKETYKIFVNPSISEVLCTTTAEALAMGKFAIIPVHPSNAFFYQFPNCLAYRNKFEFVANLRWALTHEPEPLTPELAREFSWEAATDRLIQASAITWKDAREREKLGLSKLDERIAWLHNELGKGAKGDLIRQVMGAGPASHQVKYQIQMQQLQPEQQLLLLSKAELESLNGKKVTSTSSSSDEDDDSDNEDEGLTQKFRSSSFVRAIRSTIANGLPSWNTVL